MLKGKWNQSRYNGSQRPFPGSHFPDKINVLLKRGPAGECRETLVVCPVRSEIHAFNDAARARLLERGLLGP